MNIQKKETEQLNKLSDNKYFFRAWLLQDVITSSQLEGLKRRYPKAWLNRKSYPFFRHTFVKSLDLEHEYNFNLCYCLVEYARENENLMKELTPFFLQLSKENAIFFKKNSKKHDLIVQKVDQIWKQMIINRVEIEIILLTVSLLDVLMEIYSIPFPNDSESRCIERFNQSSERFIKTFGDSRLLRVESFAKPLRTKQGKVYQFLNEYAKKTSELFQEPILSYKTSARKPRGLAPWMNRTFIVF